MSQKGSSSDSELSSCSDNFNPIKVLYSKKTKVPVTNAPMYENLQQFENAQRLKNIIPAGQSELVKKREEEKLKKKLENEKLLEEKNKQRFAQFQVAAPAKKKTRNVITRMQEMQGPLAALTKCVNRRLRVKIVTRGAASVRGELHATVVAFDKQWNLALTDVLEVWRRKRPRRRKVPCAMGTPVPAGTAAALSHVPTVTETPLGHGVWECTRHMTQLMVRGEHVVLINIIE